MRISRKTGALLPILVAFCLAVTGGHAMAAPSALRAPKPRTLRTAERALRDVMRAMNLEQANETAISAFVGKAGKDVGLATALIRVKQVAAPAVLRDGNRVCWVDDGKPVFLWTAGQRLALPLINAIGAELSENTDRRFALEMARKGFASHHPTSMDAIASMVQGLPRALARAEREPEVKATLRTLYRLAGRSPGPPSRQGWLIVNAIDLIANWAGAKVPQEVLDVGRELERDPSAESNYLAYLDDAMTQSRFRVDVKGKHTKTVEEAWDSFRPVLTAEKQAPEKP